MRDEPRQKLGELIVQYGRSLCDDPRRCEALLKDYCGQYKREIFVLVSALRNRVAEELINSPAGVPPALLWGRLTQRLEDELAMSEAAAHWAVESWALALGLITQPLPVAKPAPVPLPSPPPVVVKVAPSPSPPVAETLIADRYRDNGDGTVTDVQTGLQWMRFSLGQEWKNGTCMGEAKRYTWQETLDAASALNRQGGYAGYRDWRVPTKEELQTLISSNSYQAIDRIAFPNTPTTWFWSSSTYADSPIYAWYVNFFSGSVGTLDKSLDYSARLVRGG